MEGNMTYRQKSNTWAAFMAYAATAIPDGAEVFEIGPGNPSRSLINKFCQERALRYSWADLNNRGRGKPGFYTMEHESHVQCSDEEFDAIVSLHVLHHCRRPWLLVPELVRICKAGGLVIVQESMYEKEHRHPVDCGRIWPEGLKALLSDAGLAIEKLVVASGMAGISETKNSIGNVESVDVVGIGRKPG